MFHSSDNLFLLIHCRLLNEIPQCLGIGLNGLVSLYVWSGLSVAGRFEGVVFELSCTLVTGTLQSQYPDAPSATQTNKTRSPGEWGSGIVLFKAPQVIAVYGQVWGHWFKKWCLLGSRGHRVKGPLTLQREKKNAPFPNILPV